jgi:hypothetical protein
MFHRQDRWVQATGRVLDRQLVPGPKLPYPTVVIVELRSDGGSPLRAEVRLIPGEHNNWDLYYPAVGDVTGFIVDPASGETRFDLTDPRNSMAARRAAGEAWEARPDDQPVTLGSGPPWIVPAKCPGCGKQVNQQMAARESQPHCQNCARLLPAYPYL